MLDARTEAVPLATSLALRQRRGAVPVLHGWYILMCFPQNLDYAQYRFQTQRIFRTDYNKTFLSKQEETIGDITR